MEINALYVFFFRRPALALFKPLLGRLLALLVPLEHFVPRTAYRIIPLYVPMDNMQRLQLRSVPLASLDFTRSQQLQLVPLALRF